MAIRYSDALKRNKRSTDFVSRTHNPSLLKLIALFFLALAAGIVITGLLLPPLYFVVVMTVVMGGLGTYVIVELQRSRDLVVAAEFQNAMFASALGHNSRFTLIIKKEGAIVYMDNGLQKLYPDIMKERQFSLANLLKMAKVGNTEREKILDVVQRANPDRLLFDMRAQDGRIYPVMLTLQPISRPSGFLLLRAVDYAEDRADAAVRPTSVQMSNPLLSKSSIGMFAHIINRMGMGLYMIDMGGNMLYANPVLEQWLSFTQGEITAGQYTMRDILPGVSVEDALHPGDFEGENSLLKKEGGIIKAYINQKIIYGDDNKALGCVALITNMVDTHSEAKKRLW